MKAKFFKSIMVLASMAMVFGFSSCSKDNEDPVKGDNNPPAPVEKTIMLDQVAAIILEGTTTTLNATVTPADEKVVWTVNDTAVATVDDKGVVTSVAPGSTFVKAVLASDTTKQAFCSIIVITKVQSDLAGTWKVKSFEYTPATMQSDAWYDMITNWTGFPEKNEADRITFTADGKIQTNLSSTLKNYFQPESNYKVTNMEVPIHIGNSIANVVKPTILELDNVNRYFSDKETSEDKVAYLGVMPNADDEELLDVFIIDYNSRTFAYPDFDDWMMYDEKKPTATGGGMYILFTMERAAE